MKLEYRVIGTKDHHGISNKRYLDTGIGGLPIMLHCDNEGEKNAGKRKRKEISVIPLQNPTKVVLGQWWDEQRNGGLVLAKHAVTDEDNNRVDWSEKIEMDAAGTSGEVHCSAVVFSVSVESMAGIFFRSNVSRSLYCLLSLRSNTHKANRSTSLFASLRDLLCAMLCICLSLW